MDQNNYNNRTKIPGILIVFILVILGGFSGLTYAVADKLSVQDLNLTKIGLSNLMSVFNKEIEIKVEEAIITETHDVVTDATEITMPTPEATPEPTPASTIKPTLTPKKTPTPLPTPTPTPTPTTKPNICSVTLNYGITSIDGQFTQNKFDRERLKKIVLYAESQWESALEANVFQYESNLTPVSSIKFTQDAPVTIHNYYSGQFGQTRKSIFDSNNIIKEFEIEIFSGIFLFVEGHPPYTGELTINYSLTESIITRSVMHHMGHVLGLDYLPNGKTGIMAKKWLPTTYKPTLSQEDINLAKELCK